MSFWIFDPNINKDVKAIGYMANYINPTVERTDLFPSELSLLFKVL